MKSSKAKLNSFTEKIISLLSYQIEEMQSRKSKKFFRLQIQCIDKLYKMANLVDKLIKLNEFNDEVFDMSEEDEKIIERFLEKNRLPCNH